MTRILISDYFFAYQTQMPELVRQVVREKYIAGVRTFTGDDPVLAQEDLLPPPRIEFIALETYEGHVGDLILFDTSSDFGIANLRVTIRDEKGNVIESDYAAHFPDAPELWHYLTIASVPSDSTVIVSAAATDSLGGVGMLSKRITLNQDLLDILRGEYL